MQHRLWEYYLKNISEPGEINVSYYFVEIGGLYKDFNHEVEL